MCGVFCFWSDEATPTRTGLVLVATMYKRTPIASSVEVRTRSKFAAARARLAEKRATA